MRPFIVNALDEASRVSRHTFFQSLFTYNLKVIVHVNTVYFSFGNLTRSYTIQTVKSSLNKAKPKVFSV